ncbi:hypothetical protein TrST_g8881 [Triparma strigata]|uniref:Uncharacterized protein n=1 Tax=Triparma strigata TaxID=1606541 RepID=A0A9W7F096_9STRA|nr:hypothetical protein TrST_g8881 [Triparma strigata]
MASIEARISASCDKLISLDHEIRLRNTRNLLSKLTSSLIPPHTLSTITVTSIPLPVVLVSSLRLTLQTATPESGYEDDLACTLNLLDMISSDPLSSKPVVLEALKSLDQLRETHGDKLKEMLKKVNGKGYDNLKPIDKISLKGVETVVEPIIDNYKIPGVIPSNPPPTTHPTQRLMLGWSDSAKDILYGGWCFPRVKLTGGDEKKLLEIEVSLGLKHDSTSLLFAVETLRDSTLTSFPPSVILERGSILLRLIENLQPTTTSTTLQTASLECLHVLILRLKISLESVYANATILGGHDAAYSIMEEGEVKNTDIREYRYPKSIATSEFQTSLNPTSHYTSTGPLNGKGNLSLGGAAYAIYRASVQFLDSPELGALAGEICNEAFRMMEEPWELKLSKLSSARISSALLSLACTLRSNLSHNEITNADIEGELRPELTLGLKHLTHLPPSCVTTDPYETSSTTLNALISKLDTIPTSSTLLKAKVTVPNVFKEAVKCVVHTSQEMRGCCRELAKALTPLAYTFDSKGTEMYENVYDIIESCMPAISLSFNSSQGGETYESLKCLKPLLYNTDASRLELGNYDRLVVDEFIGEVDKGKASDELLIDGLRLGRSRMFNFLRERVEDCEGLRDYIVREGTGLLDAIMVYGPSIDESCFKEMCKNLTEHVERNRHKFDTLEVNMSLFQCAALGGHFNLEVSNIVDSNLDERGEIFTMLRGIFCKVSRSVRERCCEFFEGGSFGEGIERYLEALEAGSDEREEYKVQDEVGIEIRDYRDLCKLMLAEHEDVDVKLKAANVLSDFVRDDTPAFKKYSSEDPQLIKDAFDKVVCPNLEVFSRLFKQLVLNSEDIRNGLLENHLKVKQLVLALTASPLNDERTDANKRAILDILNGLHRVAFDVSHYIPTAPSENYILPTVCRTFYYDSSVYTINDFILRPENDVVINRVFKGITTRQSKSLEERLNAVFTKIQMAEDGKAMKESVVECHSFLNCWVGWEDCLDDRKIIKALHRVLSVPPSSTRDHELLSTTLRLVNTLLPHVSAETFASLVNSLTRIAQPVLDKDTVSPSMAEDGVDVSGLAVKNRYVDLTLKEQKRRERRGKRAIRALWKCRMEMIKFLFNAVTDDKCGEELLVYFIRDTGIVERLTEGYLDCHGENESLENFSLTARAQSSAISLLHVLLDNNGMPYEGKITAFFAEPPKDGGRESTHFETWIPKLIKLACNPARMPDSFQFKGPARSAALMLKTVSSFITSTKTTTTLLSTASSYRQLKEKAAWTLDSSNIDWSFKLLCDREAVVRSVGYGICGDLLNLAWARDLVMTARQDQDIDDELADGVERKFIRFSTSILEMACRAAADDSESPIVRSECFGLLRNAICIGGAALENNTSEVMDVIPSIGRMLSRASARMGQQMNKDEDTTTRGTDEDDVEEERRDYVDRLLLPTPTLLWAGIKLLMCLLEGTGDGEAPGAKDESTNSASPNNSLDSSFVQEGELVKHFYESGILSHAISLLNHEDLQNLTLLNTLAHLGVYPEDDEAQLALEDLEGSCGDMIRDVWYSVESSAAHACRACVFDMVALSISLGISSEDPAAEQTDVSQSLLRHTSILTHSFRSLTTEVVGLVAALKEQEGEGGTDAQTENLAAIGSCCECLREIVLASAVRDEQGNITGLSNLIPCVGAVPQALGVALAHLSSLSMTGFVMDDYIRIDNYLEDLDMACCSANRLSRLLFLVPGWGEGMLTERHGRGMSVLRALLDVHQGRVLKRIGAAELPLSERMLALQDRVVEGALVDECRASNCGALAAAIDCCRGSDDEEMVHLGDFAAATAVPDLVVELDDVCSLIALDGLRDSQGALLHGKGRRAAKKATYLDGTSDWKPDTNLAFDLSAILVVLRSALALDGGKEAALENAKFVPLLNKVWSIATDLEFGSDPSLATSKFFDTSLLQILLGVVLNFCVGSVRAKKAVDFGGRSGAVNTTTVTGKVVSLCLRKGSAGKPSREVVSLCFLILKSLALPPSPSRGALATSSLYPSLMKECRAVLRPKNQASALPRYSARAKELLLGTLSLLINSTLDVPGRKSVLANYEGLSLLIDDLMSLSDLPSEIVNALLVVMRNVAMSTYKSSLLTKERLEYVVKKLFKEKNAAAALGCMWLILYKSEKAIAQIKADEKIYGDIMHAASVDRGRGGVGVKVATLLRDV